MKSEIRRLMLEKRKALPEKRRKEAAINALKALKNKGRLLSFSPIGSEIDLSLLNALLEERKRLFLVPYRIDELFKAPLEKIDFILVPAICFDSEKNRLGYGKGYYDRFLAENRSIPTIGIGFKEQLFEKTLPTDPWDIPVSDLMLF